ncbi:synaptophysin-like protein 2 isoform X1 [Rhipicephalus microplus]|uniref:synaptophysin-like protein 2 isoform X1 n=1 Tax=Rhipicephalus microplus TaxID=6941 RepID=UPI003F6A9D9C
MVARFACAQLRRPAMDLNFRVLKEPRGFIRVLQFVFSIFAFATTSGFGTTSIFSVTCSGSGSPFKVNVQFGYPFRMSYFPFQVPHSCPITPDDTLDSIELPFNFASNAEFFVATGVLSFLYCVGILGIYLFSSKMYAENQTVPIVDLGLTALMSLFWFAGSCAWAQGVRDVKYYMSPDNIIKWPAIGICRDIDKARCEQEASGSFATLNVSLILGFFNVLLWMAGCWFVYKETSFHGQRQPPPVGGAVPPFPQSNTQYPPQSPPPIQSPTFGTQY